MDKSEDIQELATALAKAQGEMVGAIKDSNNPFFKSKYADLASVWDACREPLSKNDLAVVQTTELVRQPDAPPATVLITTLLHSSGQWISSHYHMKPVKEDPQSMGSAMTYARRYALMAMVGIAPEEDDGEQATGRATEANPKQAQPKRTPDDGKVTQPKTVEMITEPQRKMIFATAKEKGVSEEKLKQEIWDKFSVAHIADLTKDEASQLIEALTKMPATAPQPAKKAPVKEKTAKDKPEIKEPYPGMSFDDLIAYAKAHGQDSGWIFKTTSLTIQEVNTDPYKCAMEVKAIAGW